MCTALPLDTMYSCVKFHSHSQYSYGDMLRTKIKYENKEREITQKLGKQELWFMSTALPLDEMHPCVKFHNHSQYSFGDMLRTKIKYENKEREITQKLGKQELWFICTALRIDEMYPHMEFHRPRQYSFGDMLRTKNWIPPAQ